MSTNHKPTEETKKVEVHEKHVTSESKDKAKKVAKEEVAKTRKDLQNEIPIDMKAADSLRAAFGLPPKTE